MADTVICLARHGQSSHNSRKLVAGQVPSCLTRRGREDARAVAVLLKGRPFDLILRTIGYWVRTLNEDHGPQGRRPWCPAGIRCPVGSAGAGCSFPAG